MNRKEVFAEASRLTHGDREKNYGTPQENHRRIAAMWSVVLGVEVKPHEVALCMAALKIARLVETPEHVDSYVDGVAYMGIAAELATDNK